MDVFDTATCVWEVEPLSGSPATRIDVSVTLSDPAHARHEERFYNSSLRLLAERPLRSLVRRVDATLIAQWVAARAPRYGMTSIQAVTVRLRLPDAVEAGCWSAQQQRERRNVRRRRTANAVMNALAGHQTWVNLGGEPTAPTTAGDWAAAAEVLRSRPGYLISPVCPPYEKRIRDGRLAGYTGLHADAFTDPRAYNSSYDYRGQLAGLTAAAHLLASAGLPAPRGVVLLVDWALVDLPGVRTTVGGEAEVVTRLAAFAESLRQLCSRDYPDLAVLTLRELGVSSYLPLGFPMDATQRYAWFRDAAARGALPWIRDDVLEAIVEIRDDRLVSLLDWRNYPNVEGPRGPLVTFLQTYRSVAWVRMKEALGQATNAETLVSTRARDIRRFAYYDALLRFVTYQLYSILVVRHLGPAVCAYQDQTFRVAGNCFRREGFPVLFLDPQALAAARPGDRHPVATAGSGAGARA